MSFPLNMEMFMLYSLLPSSFKFLFSPLKFVILNLNLVFLLFFRCLNKKCRAYLLIKKNGGFFPRALAPPCPPTVWCHEAIVIDVRAYPNQAPMVPVAANGAIGPGPLVPDPNYTIRLYHNGTEKVSTVGTLKGGSHASVFKWGKF
jgi:hypothetical protein